MTTTKEEKTDMHDKHYRESIVEPILVMQKFFTKEELVGFLKGNVLKYRLRFGHKDGETQRDLDKIKVYESWLKQVQAGEKIKI